MRSRVLFPADEILRRATKIEVTILRDDGQTIGVGYQITGDLLDPLDHDDEGDTLPEDAETAKRLVAALLEGGAP